MFNLLMLEDVPEQRTGWEADPVQQTCCETQISLEKKL